MNQPTIYCPNCKTEIKLTESLAAPLLELTRREFEAKLLSQEQAMKSREEALQNQKEQLLKEQKALEEKIGNRVQEQLQKERISIAEKEAQRIRLSVQEELEEKSEKVLALEEIVKERDLKLSEARKKEIELLKKQQQLHDEKQALDLTIQRGIEEEAEKIRLKARSEVEESFKLKVSEKEHVIASMKKQIEELSRRAEQGSQQLQGEVQELELEEMLKAKFLYDSIEPVPKGEHGGDVVHRVFGTSGQFSGTILWEVKRTKNWNDGWLSKLKEDQRNAKAEVCVILSQTLPENIEAFERIDGVWVAHPRLALR